MSDNPDPTTVKKGQAATITGLGGATATLKKAGKDWSLTLGSRTRWGNLQEIRHDIAYFETYGTLPPRSPRSWS